MKKLTKKGKIVVFILLILGSLAFIRKTDSVIAGGDLQDFFVSAENDKVFSQQELYSSLGNFTLEGNVITSTNGDPVIYIDTSNIPIYKYVKLDVDLFGRQTADAQMFYSINGKDLNESDSVKFTLKSGVQYVNLNKSPITLLRFDPTNQNGVSLSVNSVTLTNKFVPKASAIVKVVLLFLVWAWFCALIIFGKSKVIQKENIPLYNGNNLPEPLNKSEVMSICLLISIFCFFFILNYLMPMAGEDLPLVVFPYEHEYIRHIDAIQKTVSRMWQQASGWNARVGELLSIAMSVFEYTVFDFLNSLSAIVFIWCAYIYSFKRVCFWKEKNGIFFFFLIFSIVILCMPAFGQIFLWRTGSINYLWALNILLLYCIPMLMYFDVTNKNTKNIIPNKAIIIIPFTLLGFIAGMTNENTVIVFIVLYVLIIISDRIKHKKTPVWIFTSLISLSMGFFTLLLAPSTRFRMAFYKQMFGVGDTTFSLIIKRAYDILRNFTYFGISLLAIFAILLFLFIRTCWKNNRNLKKEFLDSINCIIFMIIGFGSVAAFVCAPYFEIRGFFLSYFFIICGSAHIFSKMCSLCGLKQKYIIVSVVCIFNAAFFFNAASVLNNYKVFCNKRIDAMLESKNENKEFTYYYYNDTGTVYNRVIDTRELYLAGDNLSYLEYYYGVKLTKPD